MLQCIWMLVWLLGDNTYRYAVKADFDGGGSDLGNQVEVTPLAPITVPTPVNFMANANGWLIELGGKVLI